MHSDPLGYRYDVMSELQNLGRRLVGEWTSEATHPQMPGVVINGTSTFELLDGDQFVILRSHYDHPDMPDCISMLGDTGGLHMHYFDSRGVYRVYDLSLADDGWTILIGSDSPAVSFAGPDDHFAQRVTYRLENADREISGKCQLSHDDTTWEDDLQIVYHRRSVN